MIDTVDTLCPAGHRRGAAGAWRRSRRRKGIRSIDCDKEVSMSVPLVHEEDIPEVALTGRHMRCLANSERLNPAHLSASVIESRRGRRFGPRMPTLTAKS